MKLRFLGNSLRIRLNKSEVANLSENGRVAERVPFGIHPEADLIYSVVSEERANEVLSSFLENEVKIIVPKDQVMQWANNNQTGIYNTIQFGKRELSISIEKDFQCLHKQASEEEKDNFPNPLAEQE
ncbi:hypothetical protein AAG747_26140 [Rapidithrix thailandica]|uniref:Uncharacterized protein n=1 Tax=Rapidithrix thailandica TaxID=413964 RepID=A0AAW9SER3_9BACT